MLNRDIRDIVGGLAMLALGVFVALYAYDHYEIGTLNRMGPGFFPVGLGGLLAVIGFFIALPACFRPGSPMKVAYRTLGSITLSIVVFAVLLKSLGIVLATMAAVFLSSLADHDIRWRGRVGVAVGVAVVTWLVFVQGLSMTLPVWPWSP